MRPEPTPRQPRHAGSPEPPGEVEHDRDGGHDDDHQRDPAPGPALQPSHPSPRRHRHPVVAATFARCRLSGTPEQGGPAGGRSARPRGVMMFRRLMNARGAAAGSARAGPVGANLPLAR